MEDSNDKLPFSITPVEEDFSAITGDSRRIVRVGSNGWVLEAKYRDKASHLYNYPIDPEVVWVMGFPRSGTTLTQELVWLIHNDVDFERAKISIQKRVNLLDSCFLPAMQVEFEEGHKPNVIKTHLAFDLLPPELLDKCKVVFIARNPKDTAVSLFNLSLSSSSFDIFWKLFQSNSAINGPFWKLVLQGWARRNHPNILFLFYEDTQKDMRGTILKVANHLGKKLTEEQITALEEHMDIKNFKKNKAVNHEFLKAKGIIKGDYIGKGGTGGWREYFSEELNASADAWIKEHLEGTDFAFPEN